MTTVAGVTRSRRLRPRAIHQVVAGRVDAGFGEEALHLRHARLEAAHIAPRPAHRAQRQFGMQILADLGGDAQVFDQRRRNPARQFDTADGGADGGRLRQIGHFVGVTDASPIAAPATVTPRRFQRGAQRLRGELRGVFTPKSADPARDRAAEWCPTTARRGCPECGGSGCGVRRRPPPCARDSRCGRTRSRGSQGERRRTRRTRAPGRTCSVSTLSLSVSAEIGGPSSDCGSSMPQPTA